jgi:hypothetical protein
MHSSSWHGRGGAFGVCALGSQASVLLDVQYVPIDSLVVIDARASDATADLWLAPAFEGVYLVESTAHHAKLVISDQDVEDPKGKGRQRYVDGINWREERIVGSVRWGEISRNAPYGGVKVVAGERATLTV